MKTTLALEFGNNIFGKLKPEIKAKLQAAIDNPCQDTWDEAYSIILRTNPMVTLWQAVAKIDPEMCKRKPHGSPWCKIPDRDVIVQAINKTIFSGNAN